MEWCSFRKKGAPHLFLFKIYVCLPFFLYFCSMYINMDKYD